MPRGRKQVWKKRYWWLVGMLYLRKSPSLSFCSVFPTSASLWSLKNLNACILSPRVFFADIYLLLPEDVNSMVLKVGREPSPANIDPKGSLRMLLHSNIGISASLMSLPWWEKCMWNIPSCCLCNRWKAYKQKIMNFRSVWGVGK